MCTQITQLFLRAWSEGCLGRLQEESSKFNYGLLYSEVQMLSMNTLERTQSLLYHCHFLRAKHTLFGVG